MKLGDKVRSRVTGFEGIAYAYVCYINGCDRILVQPRVNEKGEDQASIWIDLDELEVVQRQAVAPPKPERPPLRDVIEEPLSGVVRPQGPGNKSEFSEKTTSESPLRSFMQRMGVWPQTKRSTGGGRNPDDRKHSL